MMLEGDSDSKGEVKAKVIKQDGSPGMVCISWYGNLAHMHHVGTESRAVITDQLMFMWCVCVTWKVARPGSERCPQGAEQPTYHSICARSLARAIEPYVTVLHA